MSMKSKIKNFFGANRQYAVCGASNDSSKFGYKITNWYVTHNLPVVPINPKATEILGQEVVPSVTQVLEALQQGLDVGQHKFSQARGLSISFLTPPAITVATLKQIAAVEAYRDVVKGLWFQPGSYDQEVLDTAQAIGLFDQVVFEDECILVRGDEGLYSANL